MADLTPEELAALESAPTITDDEWAALEAAPLLGQQQPQTYTAPWADEFTAIVDPVGRGIINGLTFLPDIIVGAPQLAWNVIVPDEDERPYVLPSQIANELIDYIQGTGDGQIEEIRKKPSSNWLTGLTRFGTETAGAAGEFLTGGAGTASALRGIAQAGQAGSRARWLADIIDAPSKWDKAAKLQAAIAGGLGATRAVTGERGNPAELGVVATPMALAAGRHGVPALIESLGDKGSAVGKALGIADELLYNIPSATGRKILDAATRSEPGLYEVATKTRAENVASRIQRATVNEMTGEVDLGAQKTLGYDAASFLGDADALRQMRYETPLSKKRLEVAAKKVTPTEIGSDYAVGEQLRDYAQEAQQLGAIAKNDAYDVLKARATEKIAMDEELLSTIKAVRKELAPLENWVTKQGADAQGAQVASLALKTASKNQTLKYGQIDRIERNLKNAADRVRKDDAAYQKIEKARGIWKEWAIKNYPEHGVAWGEASEYSKIFSDEGFVKRAIEQGGQTRKISAGSKGAVHTPKGVLAEEDITKLVQQGKVQDFDADALVFGEDRAKAMWQYGLNLQQKKDIEKLIAAASKGKGESAIRNFRYSLKQNEGLTRRVYGDQYVDDLNMFLDLAGKEDTLMAALSTYNKELSNPKTAGSLLNLARGVGTRVDAQGLLYAYIKPAAWIEWLLQGKSRDIARGVLDEMGPYMGMGTRATRAPAYMPTDGDMIADVIANVRRAPYLVEDKRDSK